MCVQEDAQAGARKKSTHPIVLFAADLFQSRLHALHDPPDHARILSPMFAFEHDARVADDGHLVAARQEEVAEDGTMGREECEGLFEFGRHGCVSMCGVRPGSRGEGGGPFGRGGGCESGAHGGRYALRGLCKEGSGCGVVQVQGVGRTITRYQVRVGWMPLW
jgi:hypothetical protein